MIQEHHRTNFEQLTRAIEFGHACLLDCRDKETGKQVVAICAMNLGPKETALVPFAVLIEGNPYDQLEPPASYDHLEHPERHETPADCENGPSEFEPIDNAHYRKT